MVSIVCSSCDWSADMPVMTMPVTCPECHSTIERASEMTEPTRTKSDKV